MGCRAEELSPASTDAAVPAYGDTLIMGTIGDASNLLPPLASDASSTAITSLVYNGLVRYDKDLQIEGDLAQSWDISADGREITFHLRRDVRWHDGAPFTSADVLFTYQLMIDPATPTAYAEQYRQVSKAEAPDPYTFRVRYDKPLAAALPSWALDICPKHLLEGQDVTTSPLCRAPVGTGPFRFVSWQPGEMIVLERNEDYHEGAAYLRRVLYRVIPDSTTMFLELQSGGLDTMGLTPLQFARQTETPAFGRRFNKYRYPAFAYTYLGYNLRKPLFQDKRVRQAISHAIDKQELIDGVLLGLGQPANGPYVPGSWPHNPQVKDYAFDPARAAALLEEAGWIDRDGDGVRERDGKPLRFVILTNQGNDQRIKAGEIIQRRLAEVGMDVRLRVIEWASFLKEFIYPGKFDATLLGWTVPIDPDGYNVWHSSKTGPGELNIIGFNNARVDALLEQGRRSLDQDRRQQIYWQLQEILAEEVPYTFLFVPDSLPVVARRFHGIEQAPAGIQHNLIRWFVPQAQQRYLR
ncbi:MAG: peptide-binding protein [Desulfuromonas thiophila]|nr:peptide-binding protein [Desulfuromonas thiophila]